ncbi:MAG: hypothetical protein WA192_04635, partial [Candidatus Acidiferrales bacterium]
YWTADREALLGFFSDPNKFANADPFVFLFAALLILIFGPGKFALDALLDRAARKTVHGDASSPLA